MLSVIVRVADIALVVIGAFVASLLRFGQPFPWADTQIILVVFVSLLTLSLFPALDIYQSWRGQKMGAMLRRVVCAWLLVTMLGLVVIFTLHRSDGISRLWFGVWSATTTALLLASRCVIYYALRGVRTRGFNQKTIAVVGSAEYSGMLIGLARAAPEAGFAPLCVLDESDTGSEGVLGVPVTRHFEDIVRLVRNRQLQEIWLALPLSEERTIFRFVKEFRNDFVNIRFMPDIRAFALFDHSISDVLGMPAIDLSRSRLPELETVPKQLFDWFFALFALATLIPLFCVLAVLVKLSSPGPVFFKQRRKGIDGREFTIYKFRSMRLHKEVPGKLTQARSRDSRVTRVGAFLRKTSLDELPQFINVLKGDMSVVGPRPHAIEHDNIYKDLIEGYMQRYRVKPGITGWAQINGYRGETDRIEKMVGRVKFDLYYMQNWSFWLDIKIVLLTIVKGFVGKNAY